jgi:hypothetical protein
MDGTARTFEPLETASFEAASLLAAHPPRFRTRNKVAVWEIAHTGAPFEGQVHFAQWPAQAWPGEAPAPGPFTVEDGVFDYAPAPEGAVAWHVNFADPELFGYYAGPLLAQDELQVVEHPLLGSLRDALVRGGRTARTVGPQGPTPVTVAGVQRRCAFHTQPDPAAGRPLSLYGNAFSRASGDQVAAATERLDPPPVSNILAMAAPGGGDGPYSIRDLEGVLRTAFTGFAAAVLEGARLRGGPCRTLVHTGFWGCGAFGGNRTVMTVLQALAADLAGVELIFHAVDAPGARAAAEARRTYLDLRAGGAGVAGFLERLHALGLAWGESDGN